MNGERIKNLRKELGLTQSELGHKLGVVKQTVSNWENNISEPDNDTLVELSCILDAQLPYLLGTSDQRRSDNDLEWKYPHVHNRLGNILRRYRKDNNYSEQSFSQQLNIEPETYINIELGKYTPSIELLKKISEITNYDIDYLTGAIDHASLPSGETIDLGGQKVPILYAESNYHFRARFEDLCLSKGINQINAEERIGLTKQEFIDIKWNRMPTLSELLKISYAFRVSLDYLVGKSDIRLSNLNADELALILDYRDCLPNYKKYISDRAHDLSIESIKAGSLSSVAADESLKKTGTDNQGK